jgi:hypothetical protein
MKGKPRSRRCGNWIFKSQARWVSKTRDCSERLVIEFWAGRFLEGFKISECLSGEAISSEEGVEEFGFVIGSKIVEVQEFDGPEGDIERFRVEISHKREVWGLVPECQKEF